VKNEYVITVMLLAVLAACSAPIAADCGDVVTVKIGTVANGNCIINPVDAGLVRNHWLNGHPVNCRCNGC